jgi:hypothetical protein
MDSFILQYMLKYADSYEYIEKFCFKNKLICHKNKQVICKKILKLSDYTELYDNINYCMIYKELAHKIKGRSSFNNRSYIKMTPRLLKLCKEDSSKELIMFLESNGYDMRYNLPVIVDDSIGDKDTILYKYSQ